MNFSEGYLYSNADGGINSTLWHLDISVWYVNENSTLQSNNDTDTFANEQIPDGRNVEIKRIMDVLILVSLIMIMLCMGCEISKEQLLHHIKKPIGISMGIFSQFIVLPLSAFVLLQCIPVNGLQATGILIISCCPGGTMSNVFTYFCDGDLSLSVAMTSLSTLMAMGMMPFNLWLYGSSFETESIVIPYAKLAMSLICVTSPVAVGMVLRWKFPRAASVITKGFGCLSGPIVICCLVLQFVLAPNMFIEAPRRLYAITLSLPFIGFTLGFALATVFRQNSDVRKTIAIECGVQNAPTAVAVISLSFPLEFQKVIIPIPYIYFFTMVTGSVLFCCVYQVHKRCLRRTTETKEFNTSQKRHPEAGIFPCQDTVEDEPMLKDTTKKNLLHSTNFQCNLLIA